VSLTPRMRQASRCSSSRMTTRAYRVMSGGVYLLEPAPPLVMHTVITSHPARAHLASVPPTVNSWSSGCAWMLIARFGAGGSFGALILIWGGAAPLLPQAPLH